ncbi:MAG TPA: VanZ family protein [Tepidisphaeraceae bacterium]|nr:VanZ family protein [Tepidisphaeraceae bacterium]
MKVIRRTLLVLTIAYWLLALLMTHLPKPPALGPSVGDKGQHLVGYGLLAAMLFLTLWICRPTLRWIGGYVLLTVLVYGLIDEMTQPLTGRSCDIYDWLADLAGAGMAVGLLSGVKWLWRGRPGVRRVPEMVEAGRS